jgi:hypothetical protein
MTLRSRWDTSRSGAGKKEPAATREFHGGEQPMATVALDSHACTVMAAVAVDDLGSGIRGRKGGSAPTPYGLESPRRERGKRNGG